MSYAERLKALMQKANLDQSALAKLVGVTSQAVNQWCGGDTMPKRNMEPKIAEALQVNLAVLRGEEEIKKSLPRARLDVVDLYGQTFGKIAGYSAAASAGPGALNAENPQPETFHYFSIPWLRNITRAPLKNLAVINVQGDSMAPTLQNGDQILIDQTVRSIGRDGFYVLVMNDDLQVKRISRDPKTKALMIASDNPLAQSWDGVADDDIYILGRVLWLARAI